MGCLSQIKMKETPGSPSRWHSEALRGTQRHSEALRGTQRHSEALRGTQSMALTSPSRIKMKETPGSPSRKRRSPSLKSTDWKALSTVSRSDEERYLWGGAPW